MKEMLLENSNPHQFIERSNIKGGFALTRNWLAIICIAIASYWASNLFIYLLAVWFIGCFQFAIGECLTHEASHYNLFRTKSWNDRLKFLYALPFFTAFEQYRISHADHHRYSGTEKDWLLEEYEWLGFTKNPNHLFFLWFIKPIFFSFFFQIYNAWEDIQNMSRKEVLEIFLFWSVIFGVCYGLGYLDLLLLYWFVPFVVVYNAMLYWSEVQDHYQTWTGTRSVINPIDNFFNHNNGYHYIHHLYPSIPWYKLPEAHAALCPDEAKQDIVRGFFDTYRHMKTVLAMKRKDSSKEARVSAIV